MLTSRIHRRLGIGFALLILPISFGSTAIVILLNAVLWAPSIARVVDQSLRYTIDKTTREVLYMPLSADIKFAAKAFVDVTVDRFAKGLAAVLLLFLIKSWGLGLTWQKLSYASIVIAAVWIFIALKAQREYKEAFRNSIDTRGIKPAEVTAAVADLSTIETLIQELASPDEQRVVYAIDFLESLDKMQLITPLLLYHESPAVRARALSVICLVQPEISARWLPANQAMMTDPDPNVRSEAVGALASMHNQQASDLVRPLLQDKNPRISLTAAMVLAGSGLEEDAARAEDVLGGLVSDTRESASPVRRDFAIAVRHVPIPHFRRLLVPLLSDPNPEVAEEAMRSTQKLGATDFMFVPTLISLLRNRRQKSSARELLVGFGERVLQELRMPAPKRRLVWLEPLPSIDLANQMRNLPLFGSVTVDEIFRICDTGRQVRSEPGHLLCQEALVPETVQFLLNGHVVVTRLDGETYQIEAPAVLAFQEVLEERPMAESVQTTDMTVCRTLTSEQIRALMADNSNLVPGLFQMLCRDSQAGRVLVKGCQSPRSALPADGNFNPIEKGLVLKTIPVFSRVSPDEIIALASVATEMRLTAGSDLFAEADRPAIYTLISGELSIEGSVESPIIAGPSDVIGIYETLAGIDFEFHARVTKDEFALRIDREDLVDLLVQRSALLRQVFGALFRNQPALATES